MTGSRVTIEFVVQDQNPQRAARLIERDLRRWIEYRLRRRLGRHVVGSPKIRAEKADA